VLTVWVLIHPSIPRCLSEIDLFKQWHQCIVLALVIVWFLNEHGDDHVFIVSFGLWVVTIWSFRNEVSGSVTCTVHLFLFRTIKVIPLRSFYILLTSPPSPSSPSESIPRDPDKKLNVDFSSGQTVCGRKAKSNDILSNNFCILFHKN
jgi:hypothetical protein